MKKIFLILALVCLTLTGCGKKSEANVLKDFTDKVNNANSYYLTGNMELVNNEDVFTYNINVSYKQEDYYKIELTNVVNDHKQVILRNDEGVYIITPSLNKSFKFQSDWPYNNSQVYLLSSLLDDISNDENRTFEETNDGYVFTSTVNYPNNDQIVNQKVYFNKDNLPTRVEVYDKDGKIQIKMNFDKIDLRTEFNDTYFDLNSILDTNNKISDNSGNNTSENKAQSSNETNSNSNSNSNTNGTNNSTGDNNSTGNNNNVSNNGSAENNNVPDGSNTKSNNGTNNSNNKETKPTATIDDIIYPMYLPVNTYLTSQERVNTEDGQRLILTFKGDNPFVLVEETAIYNETPEIIPTYGEVELIGPSLAVVNDNSVNWFNNGIEYYIVSDVMKTDELLQVVKSISVLPVSK